MRYKTILVHLNNRQKVNGLLSVVMPLAIKHQAHLIGIYVLPPPIIIADMGVPYGGQLVNLERERYEAEGELIRQAFEAATARQPFVSEWRLVGSDHPDLSRGLIEHARAADLVIAGQTDPEVDLSPFFDAPQQVALESGRPVVIVPYAGKFNGLGRRVMVAWNGRREATRAVFDALPILVDAEEVRVMWVNPQDDATGQKNLPLAEITTALARHGIKAIATHSKAPDMSAGEELLSRLCDAGSDLLVMGCYGHSRLRELVFGGATRSILQHMTVPVLMSH